jgi:hypothetical protein
MRAFSPADTGVGRAVSSNRAKAPGSVANKSRGLDSGSAWPRAPRLVGNARASPQVHRVRASCACLDCGPAGTPEMGRRDHMPGLLQRRATARLHDVGAARTG